MLTQEIRRKFLDYFKKRGHSIIPSSPVVPHEDPTLLFTNAGMNQFKDVFLGKSARDYKRAVTSQKCIRAGGKHNDLENVGHTSRHLTFFEMLGNFSFGDYFKEDAIQFAWEVSTQVFGFNPDQIWPTVFREDDEAFELWKKYVPEKRITRFGEKDNFWAMGDTGPCGPCSELLFDRGASYGTAANPTEDTSGERYLEFWNLVFMQYNRSPNGKMEPLPRPSIDTGAGLERVVSLKMGVESLFETDVLRSLIGQVEKVSGKKYDPKDHSLAPAFRVIADHLRCLAFAIADGVQPSNVDRGYVLRKVLRRAVRYGRQLGFDEPFLAKVYPNLISTMGDDYPELKTAQDRIQEILTLEEESFLRTLKRGGNILNQVMEHARTHGQQISGDDAFKLKDTYGLPLEEIVLLARDAEMSVDLGRYQQLEKEAKERSRSAQKSVHQVAQESLFEDYLKTNGPTKFVGYTQDTTQAKITAILLNGELVTSLSEGEEGTLILDQTPFYAEMGGQVGDTGDITKAGVRFIVSDCKVVYNGIAGHVGKLEKGLLKVGDTVESKIDIVRRQKIANNHTATHLLHWALQIVLGEHVRQAGSVVEPNRLRFDFSHHKALSAEDIRKIEDLINEKIRENASVRWYELPFEDVQKRYDIKQFFGEKYGSKVRVIDIDFSKELCGGTHVTALGNIGLFRIAKESSIAAGVRRIEAVTGIEAEALARSAEEILTNIAGLLKTQPAKVTERIEKLLEENKQITAEIKSVKKSQMADLVNSLLKNKQTFNGIDTIIAPLTISTEEARLCLDELMPKLGSGIVVFGLASTERAQIYVNVTNDLLQKGFNAQEIVKSLAPIIEGSGGGKPNSAQAGGKSPQNIQQALDQAKSLILSHSKS